MPRKYRRSSKKKAQLAFVTSPGRTYKAPGSTKPVSPNIVKNYPIDLKKFGASPRYKPFIAGLKAYGPYAAGGALTALAAAASTGVMASGGTKVKVTPAVNLGDGSVITTKNTLAIERNSVKLRNTGNSAIASSKVHKVNLETGTKPSSSIMKYLNLNGSTNYVVRDSRKNAGFLNGSLNLRDLQQLHAGFNQKLFYMSNWFQTDIDDIFTMYGWNKDSMAGYDANQQQKFYGIAKTITEAIHITNLNTYLAVDLKIHLVASKRTSQGLTRPLPYYDCLQNLTHSNNSSGQWISQRLPNHKVISPAKSFSPYYEDSSAISPSNLARNYAYSAVTTPDAQLKQSAELTALYDVVHTVKKRLNPGDVLEFTNKIGLGSGLPLHEMYESYIREKDSSTSQVGGTGDKVVSTPIAYHYVIEVVGQKTIGEARIANPTTTSEGSTIHNEKFLGTAPFKLQTEFKTSVEVANKTQLITGSTSVVGLPENSYPIKVFTSDTPGLGTAAQNFNRPYGSTEVRVQVISDDSLQTVTAV